MNVKDFVVKLFRLGALSLLGLVTLSLLSIPTAIFMGLRWDNLAVQLIGLALGILYYAIHMLYFAIMLGLGYAPEWALIGPLEIYIWYTAAFGSALFVLCVWAGFGALKLGERVWQWKERRYWLKWKKAVVWKLEDQLEELKAQLGKGAMSQEEYEQKKKELIEKIEEYKHTQYEE